MAGADDLAGDSGSPRRAELLASAYEYAIAHGLTALSLRPLAVAAGTSPRVLLYLFGSKDGLVREILARARQEQMAFVRQIGDGTATGDDAYADTVDRLWRWASDPARRGLIRLFFEAYARSLREPAGPWEAFADQSIQDMLDVLVAAQPGVPHARASRRATHTLALLRGLLLHLIARDDADELAEALREAVARGG